MDGPVRLREGVRFFAAQAREVLSGQILGKQSASHDSVMTRHAGKILVVVFCVYLPGPTDRLQFQNSTAHGGEEQCALGSLREKD